MKKLIFLASLIALVSLSACNKQTEKTNTAAADSTKQEAKAIEPAKPDVINITKTKSIIGVNDDCDKHIKRKRITAEERKALKLDEITDKDFVKEFGKHSNKEISLGKTILKVSQGRIESVLVIIDDHATFEFWISYDAQGNYVDYLWAGTIMNYAGDRTGSTVEGDKIQRESPWADEEGSGCSYSQFQIMPDLKFKKLKEWVK